jgi:hypothetical protein
MNPRKGLKPGISLLTRANRDLLLCGAMLCCCGCFGFCRFCEHILCLICSLLLLWFPNLCSSASVALAFQIWAFAKLLLPAAGNSGLSHVGACRQTGRRGAPPFWNKIQLDKERNVPNINIKNYLNFSILNALKAVRNWLNVRCRSLPVEIPRTLSP